MPKTCDKCGLPPDLCMCNAITGQPQLITKADHSRIHGLGIVSPPRFYSCLKCGKDVDESEIVHSFCPCCQRPLMKHKECGGTVVERSDWIPRMY